MEINENLTYVCRRNLLRKQTDTMILADTTFFLFSVNYRTHSIKRLPLFILISIEDVDLYIFLDNPPRFGGEEYIDNGRSYM